MKGIIVYDSVYGNTELAAKRIAESLEAEGHSAEVIHVKEAGRHRTEGDILFIGSPTRMGGMTRGARRFVKGFDKAYWGTRPVAAFDTEMVEVIQKEGASAAAKIHDLARTRGVKVFSPVLKVGVTGIRGPLADGADEVIGAYVKEFVASMRSPDAAGPTGVAGEVPTGQ